MACSMSPHGITPAPASQPNVATVDIVRGVNGWRWSILVNGEPTGAGPLDTPADASDEELVAAFVELGPAGLTEDFTATVWRPRP